MKKLRMIRIILLSILLLTLIHSLCACGTEDNTESEASTEQVIISSRQQTEESTSISVEQPSTSTSTEQPASTSTEQSTSTSTSTEQTVEPSTVVQDLTGLYQSELTGEYISEEIENQRPVAIMIDNEKTALAHYGLADADIVYECMNSTENDRITRLMAIYKDYASIERVGSIRSVRPTNFMLAAEYNAILVHDGGPVAYVTEYYEKDYVNNLSGGFARFSNGKATEFTEYVTYDSYTNPKTGKTYSGLKSRLASSSYSIDYNSYYSGKHFTFASIDYNLGGTEVDNISLPFKKTQTKLSYNYDTHTYDYYLYGEKQVDADTDEVVTFKNVILYSVPFEQLDENGYLVYDVVGSGEGYYITNGEYTKITWKKTSETGITHFYVNNKELELNVGKTYICLVPSDSWSDLTLK